MPVKPTSSPGDHSVIMIHIIVIIIVIIVTSLIVIIVITPRRMFHWTEDEYSRLTTFTSLLSVFSSLVLLPILRSEIITIIDHNMVISV